MQGNADGLQGLPGNVSLCKACFDMAFGRQEPLERGEDTPEQDDDVDSLHGGGSEWTVIPLLDE